MLSEDLGFDENWGVSSYLGKVKKEFGTGLIYTILLQDLDSGVLDQIREKNSKTHTQKKQEDKEKKYTESQH